MNLMRSIHDKGAGAGRRSGFTLIEMIAVLAILALMASLLLPNMIRKIDLDFREQEAQNMVSIREALKQEVTRNGTIPDLAAWDDAAARWSELPTSRINQNARARNRLYYLQGSSSPATLPYTQSTSGLVNPPANLRAMVVTTIGADDLTLANAPAAGVLSASDFDHLWSLPPGQRPTLGAWANWNGTDDDILIERIDYAPLFHRLILVNRDNTATTYRINDSTAISLGAGSPGASAWFTTGTMVGLGNPSGAVETPYVMHRDISFVYENGQWRAEVVGVFTGISQADEFQRQATTFLSAFWNSDANQGSRTSSQQGVLTTMYSYMYVYTQWANFCPRFDNHGATPTQVPEFLMLSDIAEPNKHLDVFTRFLIQ